MKQSYKIKVKEKLVMKKKWKKWVSGLGLVSVFGLLSVGCLINSPTHSTSLQTNQKTTSSPLVLASSQSVIQPYSNSNTTFNLNVANGPSDVLINYNNQNINLSNLSAKMVMSLSQTPTLAFALGQFPQEQLINAMQNNTAIDDYLNSLTGSSVIPMQELFGAISGINFTNGSSLSYSDVAKYYTLSNLQIQQTYNNYENNLLSNVNLTNAINVSYHLTFSPLAQSIFKQIPTDILNEMISVFSNFLQSTFSVDGFNMDAVYNNLAIPVNSNSTNLFFNNSDTITLPFSTNPYNYLWKEYNAWTINSDDLYLTSPDNALITDYLNNTIFNISSTPIISQYVAFNNIFPSSAPTSNLADYSSLPNATFTNSTNANLLFSNGYYLAPTTSYTLGTTKINNIYNNSTITFPKNITFSNLNYVSQINYSEFVNQLNLNDNQLSSYTPWQLYYNYNLLSQSGKTGLHPTYPSMTSFVNYINNQLAPLGFEISNLTPNGNYQSLLASNNTPLQLINSLNVATNTYDVSYNDALAFSYDVNYSSNSLDLANRYVELVNNQITSNETSSTLSAVNYPVSFIATSSLINSDEANSLTINDLTGETSTMSLPMNSVVLYNLNNEILPNTLNFTSGNTQFALGEDNTFKGLNKITSTNWYDYLSDVLNKQIADAKSNSLFNFALPQGVSLASNGYKITNSHNEVYLSVPVINDSSNTYIINGNKVLPNTTTYINYALSGYIYTFNSIYLLVIIALGIVFGLILAIVLWYKKRRYDKNPISSQEDYLAQIDKYKEKWLKKYNLTNQTIAYESNVEITNSHSYTNGFEEFDILAQNKENNNND